MPRRLAYLPLRAGDTPVGRNASAEAALVEARRRVRLNERRER